jgi:Inverse autotransporter, beta-domain
MVDLATGDDDRDASIQLLTPICLKNDTMIFLNPALADITNAEAGFSLGGGARRYLRDLNLILGGNIFYDHYGLEHGAHYDQLGLGIEVLSEMIDFRLNYYLPEDNGILPPFASGSVALEGLDTEVGCRIPLFQSVMETRLFAGYYDFHGERNQDIAGGKMRMEFRVSPRLIMDVAYLEDEELLGDHLRYGLRVNLPIEDGAIGLRSAFSNMFQRSGSPKISSFNSVVRDVPASSQSNVWDRMGDQVLREYRVNGSSSDPVFSNEEEPD